MSIMIKSKGKETVLISRYFFSKKFQGLGVLFDCDVAQGMLYKTILVIKLKFLFFGFWMSVDVKNRNQPVNFRVDMSNIEAALNRVKNSLNRSF